MSTIDWIVLLGTLILIVTYGVWKTRGSKNLESYLKGDNQAKWWGIGISIMATQASAITFLSTPGQAFNDGMRFIQFYFGLPIAMIILSITFIPIYYKLKVYTAYEFLESRFDLKTRSLAAILFLVQRGLAAGITIYAPAIILSSLLDWNLTLTNLLIGILVIIYTVSGGTKAVSQTQKQQMAVMMGGMVLAGIMVIKLLPEDVSMTDSLTVAGALGKLNIVTFDFDVNDRYNIWSGLTAGVFLFMSYFGTDQSQVQRYLSGKSITQSRLGLVMNGLLKIPMQFIILFIGVMVFVFYQYNASPIFFNKVEEQKVLNSDYQELYHQNEDAYSRLHEEKLNTLDQVLTYSDKQDSPEFLNSKELLVYQDSMMTVYRDSAKALIKLADENSETNDKDYVFMTFVMNNLPIGMIGLLFAVMFSAAMSSTASELNALASTTTIDIYKRSINQNASEKVYLNSSKWFTLLWGVLAIIFATTASLFENLIQAVNYLGSIFYGTILGIFIVAFYFKKVKANAVFIAAVFAQLFIIGIDLFRRTEIAPEWIKIGFLWYNLIGCLLVVILGIFIQGLMKGKSS